MNRHGKLGEGTFGIVYSATSPNSGKRFAVKRNLVEEDMSFIGTSREVDVLNTLRNHPHLVKLERVAFGHPFNDGCFSPLNCDVRKAQRDDQMHFIFGEASYDLNKYIYESPVIDFTTIKRYMLHILLGAEYMHKLKIIHRDIKPSNVLIFEQGYDVSGVPNVARICDFGLSKPFTYQGTQTPNTVTSWYRPPEITLDYPHYDYKADIWSIGCVFFEMIARRSFTGDVKDDNDEILAAILKNLPVKLSMRKYRELVSSNKWRTINIKNTVDVVKRKSFRDKIGFTDAYLKVFEQTAGDIDVFCDLLDKMLSFEWDKRYTATQCIDHPFFADNKNIIDLTRSMYKPKDDLEEPMDIVKCVERSWMAQAATEIFNNRHSLTWYTNRALFQAMDLYDRYLFVMFRSTKIIGNEVESDIKGIIHNKFDAELRFMTCLYLCIKYFSSIHLPVKYDTIVSCDYKTDQSKLVAEQFEGGFIKNCLQYNIYRPTIYESADQFDDKLEDTDIRDLIVLYSMNDTTSGMKPSELYNYYRTHLRGKEFEKLLEPVPKN